MWNFGPDRAWIDEEILFIQTPRQINDWAVRNYRKTLLQFQGGNYFPAERRKTQDGYIYRFEPFDPTIELPGKTIQYDMEYVKLRERQQRQPVVFAFGLLLLLVAVMAAWMILKKTPLSVKKDVHSSRDKYHLVTADGQDFALADYSGKYIWLDFSAPWCPPCRSQAPHMKEMEEHTEDVVFITVMVSGEGRRPATRKTASNWAEQYGLNRNCVVTDIDGRFVRHWGVRSIPLNVLISPDGEVLHKKSGSHFTSEMQQIISKHTQR
ncbi:MAG: hypothetical protein CSA81_04620 [Acidobacteria bacterium]|nr:MAG: hypothetical protein CSA81_04620 [Acidobacteriota bacterium]